MILTAYAKAMEPKPVSDGQGIPLPPDLLPAMQKAVADMQAVPLPRELRAEAQSLVGMYAAAADGYEKAFPQVEAASRRLDKAIKSVDYGSLPPAPEGQTVAGGIMTQMMSVPEVRDAWDAVMRAYKSIPSVDQKQEMRLTEQLGLTRCLKQASVNPYQSHPSANEIKRCGARGEPVTVARLVRVFHANGVTLDINEDTCGRSEAERSAAALQDATNAGRTGLRQTDAVKNAEGHVLCRVDRTSIYGSRVSVTKYDTDVETHLGALNVRCSIYPSSDTAAATQINRVKQALQALVDGK